MEKKPFYHYVCDAEARVDQLVRDGSMSADAAVEVKQMLDNIDEASYDRGALDGQQE